MPTRRFKKRAILRGARRMRKKAGKFSLRRVNDISGQAMGRNYNTAFPTNKTVRLRYTEGFSVAGSALGQLQVSRWRANGPFDPRHAGGGHSPLGYPEWAVMYNRYIVKSSRITVNAAASTTGVVPYCVGIWLGDEQVPAYSSYVAHIEAGTGVHRMLQTAVNGNVIKNMSLGFSAKRFFNVTDVNDNISRIGSTVDDVPTDEALFTVYFQTTDQVTAGPNCNFIITIDYLVEFSNPKPIPSSAP